MPTKTKSKPKPIPPAIVKAIIARGYVLSSECDAVFGPPDNPTDRFVKRRVQANPHDMAENIWLIPLAPDIYVFGNNAVTFMPNYSWGALCFFTGDQYNHKKTEKNLKKIYTAYLADYESALESQGKKEKKS